MNLIVNIYKKTVTALGIKQIHSYYIVLFLIISTAVMYSFFIEKHFATDGVDYFISVLEEQRFHVPSDLRCHSNYLSQMPLLCAVKLNLTNIPLLANVYAAGIYFQWVLSFVLCMFALRKQNMHLLLFPLISFVVINLSNDYELYGEPQTFALLGWPVLFLLLRKINFTWLDGFLLWFLVLVLSRCYESALSIILIICIFSIKRFLFNWRANNKKYIVIWGVTLLIGLMGLMYNLYGGLNPAIPSDKQSFMQALLTADSFNSPAVVFAILFIFFFFFGIFRKNNFLLLGAFFVTMLYGVGFVSGKLQFIYPAGVSFNCRTLTVTVLPFLFLIAIYARQKNIEQTKLSKAVFFIFVVVFTLGNIYYSKLWSDFRDDFKWQLAYSRGYMPVEKTIVFENKNMWPWTNIELSMIWSYPQVKSIIMNVPGTPWVPKYDPRERKVLERYLVFLDY